MTHLDVALQEFLKGVREKPGPGSNPRISEYLKTVGLGADDSISWCSAFQAWCFKQAYGTFPVGVTGAARSWLKVGQKVTEPEPGDIVIFWRGNPNSWQGHVAQYLGHNGGSLIVVGGNQSDAVTIASYIEVQLLGYRRFHLEALHP